MKRAQPEESERDKLLQSTYEKMRAMEKKPLEHALSDFHIFPAHVMDAFVRQNQDNLAKRPDPERDAVKLRPDGFQRLQRLVIKYDLLREKFLGDEFPSMEYLYKLYDHAIRYVSFERVLSEITATVTHIVTDLLQEREKNPLYRNSSFWFTAYAWLHVKGLEELIDFVAPSAIGVTAFINTLNNPDFRAKIIYIDDMAFSGSQLVEEFLRANDEYGASDLVHPLTLVLAIPFLTKKAIKLFTDVTEPNTDAQIKYTRYWLVQSPSDSQEKQIDLNRLKKRLVELREDPHWKDPLWTDDLRYMEILYSRLVETDKPFIVFEHKIPDNLGINLSLLCQFINAPGEERDQARSLVTLGGKPVPYVPYFSGSKAFYKNLTWYDKDDKPLYDTTTL